MYRYVVQKRAHHVRQHPPLKALPDRNQPPLHQQLCQHPARGFLSPCSAHPDSQRPALHSSRRPWNNGADAAHTAVPPAGSSSILSTRASSRLCERTAGAANRTALLLCERGAAPPQITQQQLQGFPEHSPSLKEGFPTQTATRSSWSQMDGTRVPQNLKGNTVSTHNSNSCLCPN